MTIVLASLSLMIVVGAALVFWSLRNVEPGSPSILPVETTTAERAEIAVNLDKLETAVRNGNASEAEAAERGIAAQVGSSLARRARLSFSLLTPRVVHGVVLDQNDLPVSGAEIFADWGGALLAHGRGTRQIATDAEGRFELSGNGQLVVLKKVEHPRLAPLMWRTGDSPDGTFQKTMNFGPLYFGDPDRPGRSREAPLVVRMWRTERFEQVVAKSDTEVAMDAGKPAAERFHLGFGCDHGDDDSGSGWEVRVAPLGGGGFVRVTDWHLSEAPAAGYDVENLVYTAENTPLTVGRGTRALFDSTEAFYYRSRSGDVHGMIMFYVISPFSYDDQCRLSVRYVKFVEGGSRNLAVPTGMAMLW